MVPRIVFLLVVACALPMMVAAIRPLKGPFSVKGRIYCDPCRVGFETPVTTYIPGAEVTLECKDRITNKIVYNKQTTTDSSGSYDFIVGKDKENHICDIKIVSSPLHDCKEPTHGRDHSRVILNRYNGIATNDRFVNNLGYMKNEVASQCADIFKKYQDFDFDSSDNIRLPLFQQVLTSIYEFLILNSF